MNRAFNPALFGTCTKMEERIAIAILGLIVVAMLYFLPV